MHRITLDTENSAELDLGPAVYTEVDFERCPAQALVDTGSHVTLVSLDSLFNTLAKRRPLEQTPAEWKNQTQQRIQKPNITLRGVEGDRLNVVGQVTATIGRENYSKTAVILVQLSFSVDILLGTELQPCLGLLLLKTSQKGPAKNMLA